MNRGVFSDLCRIFGVRLLFLTFTVISSGAARAENPPLTNAETKFLEYVGRPCPVIPLWPEGKVPDEPRKQGEESVQTEGRGGKPVFAIQSVSAPSLVILSPPKEKNTGVALVLAPGGGYGSLGANLVKEVGQWLNERGITCVLLKYRVPKRHQGYDMHFQPLQDAQRAMGILRARASEFGIDPHKIGMGGASAGGNLAACLLMNHKERWYQPVDDFDKVSCRPDFGVLLYPAYLTNPIISRERVAKLGFDKINAKDTPPTLTTICFGDKFTFGSTEFYLALLRAKVPAELHVYAIGGHGGGIAQYPFGQWADEFVRFLGQQGFLSKSEGKGNKPPAADGGEKVQFEGVHGTVLRPSAASIGKAVVICPASAEPASVAQARQFGSWLGSFGLTSLVIKPENFADAAKALEAAMKFAHAKESEWGIHSVGVCGLGEGAKAAALAGAKATRTRAKDAPPGTFLVDPAFVILFAPKGLADPANAGHPLPELKALRPTSPPILLLASGSEPALEELADYYLAIEPTRVHAECHIYNDSLDLAASHPDWLPAAARWIKDLDKKPEPSPPAGQSDEDL